MNVNMTSEIETKTNEFLRRRKLRLQQVREQSKDIAKKIRQRATYEQIRQAASLGGHKERIYLKHQENLINHLEKLYRSGIQNVGASHKEASDVNLLQDKVPEKRDLSKLRGKEAIAELRKRKQQKLDDQKKLLDKKLLARETANEISRDKSSAVAIKLTKAKEADIAQPPTAQNINESNTIEENKLPATRSDMATQWDFEHPSMEWEPVPTLALPKDDQEAEKITSDNPIDKNKRLDLFAISEEMPSSLRGGLSQTSEARPSVRPALNMVSEYLQNRDLRLRQTDTVPKKSEGDLQDIKQTILRTRSTKVQGKTNHADATSKSSLSDTGLPKKKSVTVYNHSSRDSRDIPRKDDLVVIRDAFDNEDAYSQALKETAINQNNDKEQQKRLQKMRSTVAMNKQSVEKEYKDTVAFLKSLPADKHRPIKAAFMDDQQQQVRKEKCQHKLQQEFKKIERECRSDSYKVSKAGLSRSRSKTTAAHDGDDFVARDFQYSWMPVPESDNNLAIHTIPTALKEAKAGNTVKFSKVDSYHEYRSRHKHTPPTKDTSCRQKLTKKRSQETINESTDSSHSSIASDTSSVENLRVEIKEKSDRKKKSLSDAEKIIIYKVLDSSNEKDIKENTKLLSEIAKSLIDKEKSNSGCTGVEITKSVSPFENIKEGVYKTVPEINGDNIGSLTVPEVVQNDDSNERVLICKKQCCCSKTIQDSSDKGGGYHETAKSSTSPRLKSCNTEGIQVPPAPQPSAATSTSSFATAVNKQNNAPADGGSIKFLGDGGEDAGKFYIGTSGLLKNEAYEVVIQLRKKDAPKHVEIQASSQEMATATPAVDATVDNVVQTNDNISCQFQDINAVPQEANDNAAQLRDLKEDANNMLDKAVGTSFNEAINLCSRPLSTGTSAFTQTTFCTPQQRPMLFHMSSSTSTAYMSPPELILPHFLKHDFLPSQETKRGTCMHGVGRRDLVPRLDFCSKTPPNSFRSNESFPTRNIKKRKRKHEHRTTCIASVKCHRHIDNKYSQTTRGIRKVESIKKSRPINDSLPKLDLNIRKYVNKLLELNRNTLKAVDIVNQNCSSVTTPGSSVIDISSNYTQTEKVAEKTLSLELIKKIINQQLLNALLKSQSSSYKGGPERNPKYSFTRKKSVHKVKSLNISKQFFKTRNIQSMESFNIIGDKKKNSSSSSIKEQNSKTNQKQLRKSSPSTTKFCSTIIEKSKKVKATATDPQVTLQQTAAIAQDDPLPSSQQSSTSHRTTTTSSSTDFETLSKANATLKKHPKHNNLNAVSRASQSSDTEVNFTKVAEDKLHNMEKIADLTEKCTKRLSNLARFLEEVRKNKTLAYSHFSTSESISDSDHKSEKSASTKKLSVSPRINVLHESLSPIVNILPSDNIKNNNTNKHNSEYIYKSIFSDVTTLPIDANEINPSERDVVSCQFPTSLTVTSKHRAKPPTALSRINLKNEEAGIVPHELSTVMEVDSPMSIKVNKTQCPPKDLIVGDDLDKDSKSSRAVTETNEIPESLKTDKIIEQNNPDLLQSNKSLKSKSVLFADSKDGTKLQMMDLNKFNEIMLKPFISINEYAKHCNIEPLDEGSVIDESLKENHINDDFSSLHSDGSLPDVIAELLKRNIISEPFQFDKSSGSNVNSTSESTSAVLALSRARKDKKSFVIFHNKENIAETSDTMSISSNPDLENAFKKLGMGWASSTLKKTKERLALSSTSNTSSSTSLSQFKIKSFSQEPQVLVIDSVSSALRMPKPFVNDMAADDARNAEQQTNLTNSMTVKEFLTNELANKITFSSKSDRNDTEDEFLSLVETKLPDELRYSPRDKQSVESTRSETNNRARTSTPVQVFKSMTYQSSSSSNRSNGLFSNTDELSSVKVTSNSMHNHSTSDKDDLTIPNYSLRINKGVSDCSKSD